MNSSKSEGISASNVSTARRLAAIAVVDVVGFSRLMEADETATLEKWRRIGSGRIAPSLVQCHGEIIKSTGDGYLIEFRSAVEAVRWSLILQRDLAGEVERGGLQLRIAVHIADIVTESGDIFGSDVNIASRLQEFARPGRTIISATVHDRVRPVLQYDAEDLGTIELKNIRDPVHAFSIAFAEQASSPLATRQAARSHEPSIAVMPFRVLGPAPIDQHFAEGIVYDIAESLAAIKELFVIASSSTIALAATVTDVAEVGRRLGVRYLLTGTIRRVGQVLRLQTELVDVETNGIVWRDRHDVDGTEIFATQDQISTRVARALLPHLRQSELQRALRKRPEHLEAYDLVLQALHRLYRFSEPEFMTAGELLRRAIERDPTYSAAYAWLAQWQIFKVGQGYSRDHDVESREAQRLALLALDRNPTDPRALAVYGHTLAFLFKQLDQAIEIFDRAIAYGPSSAIAWGLSAPTFYYIGEYDRAIERTRFAIALSPLDPLGFFFQTSLTVAHYLKSEHVEAAHWGRRTMAANPNYSANIRPLIAALAATGLNDEARSAATALLAIEPGFKVSAFLARYPLRDRARLETYGEHLRSAGLPE